MGATQTPVHTCSPSIIYLRKVNAISTSTINLSEPSKPYLNPVPKQSKGLTVPSEKAFENITESISVETLV